MPHRPPSLHPSKPQRKAVGRFAMKHEATGFIGPNAVIRVAEALQAIESGSAMERVFRLAGIERYVKTPPADMIDEREVTRLHATLHASLGETRARTVGWLAGRYTADYLLTNRIPRFAQTAMRLMPRHLAARTLSAAIVRNAWTFAGTGIFSVRQHAGTIFSIRNCPLCRGARATAPYCDFYAGTFEGLFRALVSPDARATEIGCAARGDPACVFVVTGAPERQAAAAAC
jgi:divinyl protochlorophyllide a 8-vinyl-reductase